MSNRVDTVHECDGQMDGRTDRQTERITITKTVQRIASHGKKWDAGEQNRIVSYCIGVEKRRLGRLFVLLFVSHFITIT